MAHKANYTWIEWLSLDEYERASEIAHQRVSSAISTHVQEAYTKYADRLARGNRKR